MTEGSMVSALVVDDDEDYSDAIQEHLRRWGYRVTIASSIREARHHLGQRTYGLVVMDNVLNDDMYDEKFHGSRFVQSERDLFGDATVVLATGYALGQIANRGLLEASGVHVLSKGSGSSLSEIRKLARSAAEAQLSAISARVRVEEAELSRSLGPLRVVADVEVSSGSSASSVDTAGMTALFGACIASAVAAVLIGVGTNLGFGVFFGSSLMAYEVLIAGRARPRKS